MIWNLNIQQQLTPSTAVMVGLCGEITACYMLNREEDANTVLPTASPAGVLAGSSPLAQAEHRLNPNAGDIRYIYWGGDAEFDALEAQVSKRMSHGFQAQGSYNWGKAIGHGSTTTRRRLYEFHWKSVLVGERCRQQACRISISPPDAGN